MNRIPGTKLGVVSLFVLFLLTFATHAAAQNNIRGKVMDPLGAAVSDASVVLMQGTTSVATTKTDVDGAFSFMSVSAGRYRAHLEVQGFAPYDGDMFFVGNSGSFNLNIILQVGALKQDMVVSATGTETPISQVGASVTVIDSAEIQAQNKLDALENLRQVPGAQVVQTAGHGSQTSLFIRGGEATFNKVLIDGVPVNNIGGGFDYAQLSNNGIGSMEVLRGSNSVLYGSDALAGVVNITTRQGTTAIPEVRYSVDGGNFATLNQDVSLGGAFHRFDYFTDYNRYDTQGNTNVPNSFFHNSTVSGSVGWQPNSTTTIRLTGRHDSTDAGTPNAFLFFGISDDASQRNQNTYAGATVENQTTSRWHNLVRWGYSDANDFNLNPTCTGTPDGFGNCLGNLVTIQGANGFSGTGQAVLDSTFFGVPPFPQIFNSFEAHRTVYAQSDYNFYKDWTATFGFTYTHENGSSNFSPRIVRNNYSYFLETHGSIWHRLYITAGVGLEDNQVFGFAASPRVSAAYYLRKPSASGFLTDTKLKFNWGEGIKEPSTAAQGATLYDLLTPEQRLEFGVEPIGPERSRTLDAGVEQGFWNGRMRLDVTYFHNNFYDLVAFLSVEQLVSIGVPPDAATATGFGAYVNASSTKSQGIETSLAFDFGHGLVLKANYTYLDAFVTKAFGDPAFNPNFPTIPIGAFSPLVGSRPFNRAPHTVTLLATYTNRKFTAAFSGYMVTRRDSSTFLLGEDQNGGNTLLLPNRNLAPAYQKFDLAGRYSLTSFMSAYVAIENLFNQQYQATFGFPGTPFSVRGGLTFTFGGHSWPAH